MKKTNFPQHLLTGLELSSEHIDMLLKQAAQLKKERQSKVQRNDLSGCQLALLFDKPSLRTCFSFTVAMRELGGDAIEVILCLIALLLSFFSKVKTAYMLKKPYYSI